MIKKLFLNDRFVLSLILLNAIIIFISGFKTLENIKLLLLVSDNIITGLFIAEVLTKLKEFGIKNYFISNWNKFDFFLIAISIPSLIAFVGNIEISNFAFLLVFRVLRVFKSFRFLKFIPGIDHFGIVLGDRQEYLKFYSFTKYICTQFGDVYIIKKELI